MSHCPARPPSRALARPSTTPPTPVRCSGLKKIGGLAVPWISYTHGGHAAFGSVDPGRRTEAFTGRLCQICGQRLQERACLPVRPMDVRAGVAPEPGLHPECLAYSAKACPMLNGAAAAYRTAPLTAGHPIGRPCADPACPCLQITADDGHRLRAGRPADDWDCWMIGTENYRLLRAARAPGTILGIDLDVPVLRIRPLRRGPGPGADATSAEQLRALRAL